MPRGWPGEGRCGTRCSASPSRAAAFPGPVPLPSAREGGKWLRCPKKLFAASTSPPPPPRPPFCFWDVKANVNPSNRNYSKEIHIMYSKALHPNGFKIFR